MRRVWSHPIIVTLPRRQHSTRLAQRGEQRLVQAFVTQPADEAFCKSVLLRLAWCDVVPADLALLAPAQDRRARQLRTVVADTQQRTRTAPRDQQRQLACHPCTR